MISFTEFLNNKQANPMLVQNKNPNLINKPDSNQPDTSLAPNQPQKRLNASGVANKWRDEAKGMGMYAQDADSLRAGIDKAAAENPNALKSALMRFASTDPNFKKAVSKLGNSNFTNSLNKNN